MPQWLPMTDPCVMQGATGRWEGFFPRRGACLHFAARRRGAAAGKTDECGCRTSRIADRGIVVTVYLPIAELSVNIFIILGMGAAVGFLSGMFGVGGGFLITPLLIFYNIPPVVAVATGANQVVASSVSGAISHFRRGTLDMKLGSVLLVGGIAGAAAGIVA